MWIITNKIYISNMVLPVVFWPYVVNRPTVVHSSLAFHIFDISPLTAETLCEASGQYDHSDSLKSFSSDIQDHGCYSNTSNDIFS